MSETRSTRNPVVATPTNGVHASEPDATLPGTNPAPPKMWRYWLEIIPLVGALALGDVISDIHVDLPNRRLLVTTAIGRTAFLPLSESATAHVGLNHWTPQA